MQVFRMRSLDRLSTGIETVCPLGSGNTHQIFTSVFGKSSASTRISLFARKGFESVELSSSLATRFSSVKHSILKARQFEISTIESTRNCRIKTWGGEMSIEEERNCTQPDQVCSLS